MITVKLSTGPYIPLTRIMPGGNGVAGNFRFFVNENIKRADWWVVTEGLRNKEQTVCPPENTLLITQETEFVKQYQQKFVNQFNWVITCNRKLNHPRKIITQQGYFSYLFMRRKRPEQSLEEYQGQFKTYDELSAMKNIQKTKLISAIASHKLRSPGAVERNRFIRAMRAHFGDRLDAYSNKPDVFGPGTIVAGGYKWDVVAPYKYHLAIENSYVPHYWTEKLLDAYLAGSYPFYYGHPSVLEYFPKDSLTFIDVNDIPGSIAVIEKAISEQYYEKRINAVWEARKLVLEKYNLFQTIADNIASLPSSGKSRPVTLKPEVVHSVVLKNRLVTGIKKIPLLRTAAQKVYRTYRTARFGEQFDEPKHEK